MNIDRYLRGRAGPRETELAERARFWGRIGAVGLLALAALGGGQAIARRRRQRRTVGDVMVREVVTIAPTATLLAAARLMRDANVGMLPIVEHGRLRSVVTDRDLVVRAIVRAVDPEVTPVRYFESESPIVAEPGWDVREALQIMRRCRIGRLPVVDPEDGLVGLVTLSSLALRSPEGGETLEASKEVARRTERAHVQ